MKSARRSWAFRHADSLARLFTLSRVDRNVVAERRGDANRLGCAVQLALLRYPGTALAYLDQPLDALVSLMAGQLEIPATAFAEDTRRPLTLTDHARQLAAGLRLRPNLAGEDPLVRAADRWKTLRKFAPALIEALQFRSKRASDPMLAALTLLTDLNQSGKRDVPPDAPMPFRKEWRRVVIEEGGPNRRLLRNCGSCDAARQTALG